MEFSPIDRCLASCSGDRTVKLWSIADLSCLRTFQGHTASVLSVAFVSAGAQLVSGGADGLVKVWTVRSDECEATLDAHTDKVWALTVAKAPPTTAGRHREEEEEGGLVGGEGPNAGLVVVSGGADSVINVWKDVTAREEVSLLRPGRREGRKVLSLGRESGIVIVFWEGDGLSFFCSVEYSSRMRSWRNVASRLSAIRPLSALAAELCHVVAIATRRTFVFPPLL